MTKQAAHLQTTRTTSGNNGSDNPLPLILKALDDKKGLDIKTVDLTGKSSIADALVVCTGTSDRHVEALAKGVMNTLEANDFGVQGIEGIPGNEWVLVDAGDVIVHVFLPELRGQYNLEKMWAVEFT